MKFENTEVFNFDGAIRGARNPLESWKNSDSSIDNDGNFIIGTKDMGLLQRLLKASIKEGNSHSKFLRQIFVCVDITAPLYWWKEADTYKVGTVANSTSTMHKIQSNPITIDCFETDDMQNMAIKYEISTENSSDRFLMNTDTTTEFIYFIDFLEKLRQQHVVTNNKRYWKELIRFLPESWLQTRTVTMNYQVIRQMYFDRKNHKLNEWSGKDNPNKENFVKWVESLPYAKELIMYEGD